MSVDSNKIHEGHQQKTSFDNEEKKYAHRPLSVDWNHVVRSSIDAKASVMAVKQKRSSAVVNENITLEEYEKLYCTGSKYIGKWDALGMAGYGVYEMAHGVRYEGYFMDGMFHGKGTLIYPMGHKLMGIWSKGELVRFRFIFPDGLEYTEPWKYLLMPDRRYQICIKNGLKEAPNEYITNEQPTMEIPEGCFDTGRGFFNPKTKAVSSKNFRNKLLDVPRKYEETWIVDCCRRGLFRSHKSKWFVGHDPSLYEHWFSGRKQELQKIWPTVTWSQNEPDDMHVFMEPDYNTDKFKNRLFYG